ncbi:MAG: hypothetical protein AAFX50_15665 [Acidobacteriota bacterium]
MATWILCGTGLFLIVLTARRPAPVAATVEVHRAERTKLHRDQPSGS